MSVFKNIRILVDEALLDSVIKHLLCHKITNSVNLCDVWYQITKHSQLSICVLGAWF